MVRRALKLKGTDVVLELSKVTRIHSEDFKSIHIDQLPDGTYRLIYGSGIIDKLSEVESFEIIREDI